MFQNSSHKLKNTGKWQFELHLFLNKGRRFGVLDVVCEANPCHRLTVVVSHSRQRPVPSSAGA